MSDHQRDLDGIWKRCGCARKRWSGCPHPWYFAFRSGKGNFHRFNLNKRAGKPRNYVMAKSEAESLRDLYRSQIRAHTLTDKGGGDRSPDTRLSMRDVAKDYSERYVNMPSRRPGPRRSMSWYVTGMLETEIPSRGGQTVALGDKAISEVTRADVEALRAAWMSRKRGRNKGGFCGLRNLIRRVRHFFNWSIEEGYVNQTPFRREGRAVIRLDRSVETGRTRRLEAGDEERLLKVADPYLRDLLIGLLDTGCRKGELLNLRWKDVRLQDGIIVLQAEATKTNTARAVPISTRLKAVLEMRRTGPDGKDLPADAFVFGTETGERRRNVHHGWTIAVLRAYGHDPDLVRGKISPKSRAVFQEIDLHMHDLRRECGSRLLEAGAGIHEVRKWLGHTDISTTGRYLAVTAESLKRTLKRLEEHRAPKSARRPLARQSSRPVASTRIN